MTGNPELYLGGVVQEAYISVDEEGTSAAAATGQYFMMISGTLDQPIPVHINRPFFFIIRDSATGQFLFIGRVVDPNL